MLISPIWSSHIAYLLSNITLFPIKVYSDGVSIKKLKYAKRKFIKYVQVTVLCVIGNTI
jgi:hypothetical protein